jgi:hypothetical protein
VSNLLPQVEKLKKDGCVLVIDLTSVTDLDGLHCQHRAMATATRQYFITVS